MTVDTQKLRELLEKATPGPWKVVAREVMEDASVYPTHIVGGAAEFQVCLMESPNLAKLAMDDPNGWPASGKAREANTAYIAAVNPATVSALLDEIDRLRESLAWCAGTLQMACDSAAKLREVDMVGLGGRTRTVASVLDMANSALPPAPPQGEKE